MPIEDQVAAHYSRSGMEETLLAALKKSGKDIDPLTAADLSAVDELHLGWLPVTLEFAKVLAFPRGAHVLDVGSGLGGPARHFSGAYGVRVTGIDLTADFVALANALTKRVGLAERAAFHQANALALPFDAASFDGAYTMHVAMNIREKAKLFAEVRRVLRPGALFGVYDVMRGADGDLPYPMPWAPTIETSFVETPRLYKKWLGEAGFAIASERDRSAEVREIGRQASEKVARDGPPALGRHTLAGPDWQVRFGNVMSALQKGIIAPVEIIARAV